MDRFEAMCRMVLLMLMLKGTCFVNGLSDSLASSPVSGWS